MAFLKKYPLPIAGLILAMLALGNLLKPYSDAVRLAFGVVGGILYLIFIVKLIVFNVKLKEPLNNPVVASVFPAITMATMLVPTYIKPYAPYLVTGLWYVGLVGHGFLEVWFGSKFLYKLNIKNVFPSWYIVFCGIAVGSVTAPASLLLSGYISAFEVKWLPMVYFLLFWSLLFYFIALFYLPNLLKLKFSPAYSAFTFPLVISAVAGELTAMYFMKQGIFSEMIWLARLQEAIATLIVLWVLFCYLKFLFTEEAVPQAK